MKKIIAAALLGTLALSTATGCAKRQIDADRTGSVEVPGTNGTLMKFCDGSILIYWTPSIQSGEDDDYEFIVYDGCTPDGQIINGAAGKDINPGTPSTQPSSRTEDLDAGENDD